MSAELPKEIWVWGDLQKDGFWEGDASVHKEAQQAGTWIDCRYVRADLFEHLEQENAERVKAHNEIFGALQRSEQDNVRLRANRDYWREEALHYRKRTEEVKG